MCESLSGCLLLVSSDPWEKDDALLLGEAQKNVKAFLLSTYGTLMVCAENTHHSFLPSAI